MKVAVVQRRTRAYHYLGLDGFCLNLALLRFGLVKVVVPTYSVQLRIATSTLQDQCALLRDSRPSCAHEYKSSCLSIREGHHRATYSAEQGTSQSITAVRHNCGIECMKYCLRHRVGTSNTTKVLPIKRALKLMHQKKWKVLTVRRIWL